MSSEDSVMKNRALVVAISLALVAGGALAKGKQEEDSVYSWGRWKVLSPAAGNPGVRPVPTLGALVLRPDDSSRFDRKLQSTGGGGAPTGGTGGGGGTTGGSGPVPTSYATYRASVPFSPPPGVVYVRAPGIYDGATLLATIDTQLDAAGSSSFHVAADAGDPNFTPNDPRYPALDSLPMADVYPVTAPFTGRTGSRTMTGAKPVTETSTILWRDDGIVTAGFWMDQRQKALLAATVATGTPPPSGLGTQGDGAFVQGITTPLATMDALQRTHAVASYTGPVFQGGVQDGQFTGLVQMRVSFGQATWIGNFSHVTVPFEAIGRIQGANLVSKGFSSNIDASKSLVQGSFFGANAERVGGNYTVTTTGGQRSAGVYVGVKNAAGGGAAVPR